MSDPYNAEAVAFLIDTPQPVPGGCGVREAEYRLTYARVPINRDAET